MQAVVKPVTTDILTTMLPILVDKNFRALIHKHGVAATARILRRRYSAVRDAVERAKIEIKRGRRVDATIKERNKQIRKVRKTGKKFLHQIGKTFKIGRERVRQILKETGGDPL